MSDSPLLIELKAMASAMVTSIHGYVSELLSGYAPLVSGRIPAIYLPSYMDIVQEFSSISAFPATGAVQTIYLDQSTNLTYRWSGSTYLRIDPSPGTTDSLTQGTVNLYLQTAAGAIGLKIANALSELSAVAATARANLGLGGAALLNVGTTAGTVCAGDDSRLSGVGGSSTPDPLIYLPLTGTDGSTIITDLTNASNVMVVGSARISTAKSCLGAGSSLTLSGDGSCLVIPGDPRFSFVSRNSSLSFWVYFISASPQQYARLFQSIDGDLYSALSLFFNANTLDLWFNLSSPGGHFNIFSSYVVTLSSGVWYYVEYDRNYNDHYLSLDGNIISHVSSTLPLQPTLSDMVIGGQSVGSGRSIEGYMWDFLILPYCRNTTNFTRPSRPFDYTGYSGP